MKILFSIYLALGFSFYLFSQGSIAGNIRDDSGNPMEGVSISLENVSFGVASNSKGDFLIDKIPFGDYTIVMSAIGFTTYKEKIKLTEKPINLRVVLSPESYLLNEIGIVSTRATNETPVAYQSISAEDIKDHNQGQDLPYLLRFTPSLVVNSDAGAGIGYTGMRIRGADITRINVTLNGIPVNDAESHGVFWVNMPDLASSISDVQIQRGVGTSTNGSGAFGASIHLNTNVNSEKAYASSQQSFGSFNSWKRNIKLGTGNMGNGFSFDARLSKISSDGYIDRAKADLNSFSLFGTWKQKNSVMRFSIIDGSERTYQAWNGVPLSLEADWNTRTFNSAGAERQGSPHPDEIDNYRQKHYQWHYDRLWSSKFTSNIALHYTKGRGYFEQFRSNQNASDYSFSLPKGIDPTTNIDVIRRRWLDNDFYGGIFSVTYKDVKMQSVFGGAMHNYEGQHFGELISAWTDFQLRHINYQFEGFNDSGLRIPSVEKLTFFNPKAGLLWEFKPNYNLFISYAIANREPNRDDYVDNLKSFRPKAENLQDIELGFRASNKSFQWEVNGFYMKYKNMLVQTGRLNDVGAYIRENMPDAYRIGVEWQAGWQINRVLEIKSNLAVSANKIGSYTAFIDDYDANWEWQGQVALPFTGTDIAFSPGIIAAAEVKWSLFSHLPFFLENPLEVIWNAKYVSKQYLDNTGNDKNVIPSFFINDASVRFQLKKNITISGNVFNVLNHRYFSNGWVYSSFLNGKLQSDIGVYPQAGRHFFVGFEFGF